MSESMKAMSLENGVVSQVEIPKPAPGIGEVCVKVIAASVNPAEDLITRGELAGRFLHAKTSPMVVGWDFAGTVDSVGEGVSSLEAGTPVWGHLAFTSRQKQGSYAEFITIPETELAVKPESVSFHTAAAGATVSMTGLQSMRDNGGLKEGGKVLIVGAAGGIGSVSIGIAKRLGAHVTAICGTGDVQLAEALGADEVIDRKKSDPLKAESTFDLIFDTPAVYSYGKFEKLINANGAYVTTLPGLSLFSGMLRALVSSKKCRFVQVASKRVDLELVGSWLAEGLVVPIDSTYKIAELDSALKRQVSRERKGRVVVEVADGW